MNHQEFRDWCIHRHDIECNQKYDDNIPYSKHLEYVVAQAHRFRALTATEPLDLYICMSCWGHDLIEDARVTYNDILHKAGRFVADIVYCCTDEKGRNRDERHSIKYYTELSANKPAVFVKLCDILANVHYSILTNSSMLNKYKNEHMDTMTYMFIEDFKPMYTEISSLLSLPYTK